jgi:phosphate transport system protein
MFKKLMEIMRKGDLVEQAIEETAVMFSNAKKVYEEAIAALKENREPKFDIYAVDREINDSEKSIRRKLLENMAINPRQDIVASLVVTSIIIDIERIGDYSKNIYELNQIRTSKKTNIDSELLKQANFLADQFDAINNAFGLGDPDKGKILMDRLDPVRKFFEKYIRDIVHQSNISIENAVINTLFARYLKRVGAHLENIASGIVNPFDRIGFYKKEDIT